jgi:hypothetical protein
VGGEVVLVESLGADSYVHTSLAGNDSKFVARTEGYDARRPGTNVRLHIDPDRMFGFDPDSEERLGAHARGNEHEDGRSDGETRRPSVSAAG